MTDKNRPNPAADRFGLRVLPVLAITVGLLSLFVLMVQAPRIWQQIEWLSRFESRIIHDAGDHLEASFLQLELAVLRATDEGQPDLGHVRALFTDLQKEISALKTTIARSTYPGQGRLVDETNAALTRFAAGSEPLTDFFKADDAAFMGARPQLINTLEDIRASLDTLTDSADRMALQNDAMVQEDLGRSLLLLVLAAIVLFASTALLASVFWRISRINLQRARENRLVSARLETVVDTSQDAIIVTDDAGVISGFSRAAETIFGMASSIARGLVIGDLIFHMDGRALSLASLDKPDVERIQMVGRDAVGHEFPIEISLGTALRDGNTIRVFFLRDISARLAVEEDLRASRDKAQASERAKAHFLAVMSHEMRTPLTGILGAIELMRTNADGRNTKDYLDILQSSGELLLGHINDVLDLTEIESMGINLTERVFDMDALLADVTRTLIPSAERKSNSLVLHKSTEKLGWFRGDPGRIRQILINLIGNAIKFTNDGQITVDVDVAPDTEGLILGRQRIEIQIADTGAGIAQNQLDRIFEDFVRLEDTAARKTEGTGLGLGIVKRLVSAMGGKLGAESVLGEGSLFWISLSLPPVELPASMGEVLTDPSDVPRSSVLLIEDNEINRFILREMLERDGHRVAEAEDGGQGVEMAAAEAYDLIFMDINMPHMNGVQAAKAIRAGKGKSAKSRIVALTAHVFDHDLRRFRDAGMEDVVIKPLRWEGLRRVMRGNPATTSEQQPEPATGAGRGALPPLLDREVLNQLHDTLGPEKLGRLLDQFTTEAETALSEIRAGLHGPRQVLRDRLHGFAGQAATFGARRLHSFLGTLEDEVLEMPPADMERLPDRLEGLWTVTRKEVRALRTLLPVVALTAEVRPKGPLRDANDPRRMI